MDFDLVLLTAINLLRLFGFAPSLVLRWCEIPGCNYGL